MAVSTRISSAGQVFFEDVWAPARQARSAGDARLSAASVRTYGWQWKAWCDFLRDAGVRWDRAGPQHVAQFLQRVQSSRVESVALPVHQRVATVRRAASAVTRMRYARALEDIYDVAVISGHCRSNPVPASAAAAATAESLVLNALQWQQLVDAVRLPAEPTWIQTRDAALLLVMLQAGLTVGEVQALDLADVIDPRGRTSTSWAQLPLPITGDRPRLSVHPYEPPDATARERSRCQSQARQVPLEPAAAAALSQWLRARLTLPAVPLRPDSPLFCSRKQYGRLAAKSLFLLANQHILATLGPQFRHGTALPRAGPSTLRNSCIARWLQMFDEQTVVRMAGLKDAASLARLRVAVSRAQGRNERKAQ